jgi:hypothetical protein
MVRSVPGTSLQCFPQQISRVSFSLKLGEVLGFVSSTFDGSATLLLDLQDFSLFLIRYLRVLAHKDDQRIAVIISVSGSRNWRGIVRHGEGQWRGDIITLPEPLQSLELIHGLEEVSIGCRLITQDSVNRGTPKWLLSWKIFRFMPSRYTETPVFLRNLLNQNLLQCAHRFQVLLQAAQ